MRKGEGAFLRRLYSTFAGGWPGVGLLSLRLVVSMVLLVSAGSALAGDPPMRITIGSVFASAGGVLLLLGLWTPIAGALIASMELWQALTTAGERSLPLVLATIGGALAMLGPGLWSIDARLFGWKRVEAPRPKAAPNSRH